MKSKKVVHLCLACFFPDGYSYQENMLPKFHKQLGYDVEVIASLFTFDKNGEGTYIEKPSVYRNEHDIQVTRLAYRAPVRVYRKLKRFIGLAEALEKAAPDIIFMHGCQFLDIDVVVRYLKKHPGIRVFVDNHSDYSNSATNWLSRNILHRFLWRRTAHMIEPYTVRFYGVLPARVDFLEENYKLPREKIELLVMGSDDDKVIAAKDPEKIRALREQYGIRPDDFLIMTGGKIDKAKTQTLLLMSAVKKINRPNVRLIVFGSVIPDMKEQVAALADGNIVQYIGWIQSANTYQYFAAADLAVFPGRHSVFWEEVAGIGVPMMVKYWPGTDHVDVGGNVVFLRQDSEAEIMEQILRLVDNPGVYQQMKTVASEKAGVTFSYKDIARRSIQVDD